MESAGGARLCAPESKLNTSRAYVLASDTEHHIHVFKKKRHCLQRRGQKHFPAGKLLIKLRGEWGRGGEFIRLK